MLLTSDWRDDPRGAPPLRRDERDRMGWRRDEPPRDRDSDYDGRPRDRDSGGGWRRGASDLRDERSRDSGQGRIVNHFLRRLERVFSFARE